MAAVRARQFDQVPGELIKFVNAGGKKLQGLVNRRTDEIRVWSTDEPGSEDVSFTSGAMRLTAVGKFKDGKIAGLERDYAQAQARAVSAALARVQGQGAVTARVGQQAADNQVRIETRYRTLKEKVPVYVPAKPGAPAVASGATLMPLGAIVLLDAAARGSDPDAVDLAVVMHLADNRDLAAWPAGEGGFGHLRLHERMANIMPGLFRDFQAPPSGKFPVRSGRPSAARAPGSDRKPLRCKGLGGAG